MVANMRDESDQDVLKLSQSIWKLQLVGERRQKNDLNISILSYYQTNQFPSWPTQTARCNLDTIRWDFLQDTVVA